LHDPLGQRAGMEVGFHLERGRRLPAVRSGDRNRRRDRGGTAAPLRRHDARQGPSPRDGAAAVFPARTTKERRPAPVRVAHALYPGGAARTLRVLRLAARDAGAIVGKAGPRAGRSPRAHPPDVAIAFAHYCPAMPWNRSQAAGHGGSQALVTKLATPVARISSATDDKSVFASSRDGDSIGFSGRRETPSN